MSAVGLPKVVTTATSDWRTWKTKSSKAKIKISTAPMMMVKRFRLMGSMFVHVQVQKVFADLVFQVENHHVLRVRDEQDVFARVGRGSGERLEIRALLIDGRRGG